MVSTDWNGDRCEHRRSFRCRIWTTDLGLRCRCNSHDVNLCLVRTCGSRPDRRCGSCNCDVDRPPRSPLDRRASPISRSLFRNRDRCGGFGPDLAGTNYKPNVAPPIILRAPLLRFNVYPDPITPAGVKEQGFKWSVETARKSLGYQRYFAGPLVSGSEEVARSEAGRSPLMRGSASLILPATRSVLSANF